MHKRDTCDARLLDPGALVESRAFRAPPAALVEPFQYCM